MTIKSIICLHNCPEYFTNGNHIELALSEKFKNYLHNQHGLRVLLTDRFTLTKRLHRALADEGCAVPLTTIFKVVTKLINA